MGPERRSRLKNIFQGLLGTVVSGVKRDRLRRIDAVRLPKGAVSIQWGDRLRINPQGKVGHLGLWNIFGEQVRGKFLGDDDDSVRVPIDKSFKHAGGLNSPPI